MNRRALFRWSASAAAAIVAHGALGALVLRWDGVPDAAAPAATVVLELSPLFAAPEMQASDRPPAPAQLQADAPPEVAEKNPDEARKTSGETFEPRPDEPRPERTSEPGPETAPPSETAGAGPGGLPSRQAGITAVEEPSEAEVARLPDVKDIRRTDAPRSGLQQRRRNARMNEAARQKTVRPDEGRKPAPNRAATRPQPAQAREAAAFQAPAVSTPRNSNALPNWKSTIIGILERNKRYPAEAAARHEHGTASLAFSLNRQGRVTSARIAASSGSPALDAETLALVRRVQPFPPPPPEAAGAQISLIVAIRYGVR